MCNLFAWAVLLIGALLGVEYAAAAWLEAHRKEKDDDRKSTKPNPPAPDWQI